MRSRAVADSRRWADSGGMAVHTASDGIDVGTGDRGLFRRTNRSRCRMGSDSLHTNCPVFVTNNSFNHNNMRGHG